MVDSYYVINVRNWLQFSVALLSLSCSLLTLFIIKYMRIWNGNILLIATLTSFQVLYDINFMLGVSDSYALCVLWNFLDVLGGLATSFTTNVMAFTAVYVTVKIRSINIFKAYPYFLIFILGLPLAFAIMTFFVVIHASQDDDKPYTTCVYNESTLAWVIGDFYYWARLVSIILNFLAFWYMTYKIRRLGFTQSIDITRQVSVAFSSGASKDNPILSLSDQQLIAVQILAKRMRFYPLVQALCRSGAAWNEYNNYQYSDNASSLMAAACSPLTGLFYMMIFLVMQPNAWKVLQSFFYCNPSRPPPPQPLAEKMKTANFFRASASELDDGELEDIINSPSMQGMVWTLNPSLISMSRISESSPRHSKFNDKTTDENDFESRSDGYSSSNSRMGSDF